MQPIDPEGKPKVHEPRLNHIGLWVDDLRAAVDWLTARGLQFTPGGIRRGAAGFDVCFIHPRGGDDAPQGGEGVLIELVQAPDAGAWPRRLTQNSHSLQVHASHLLTGRFSAGPSVRTVREVSWQIAKPHSPNANARPSSRIARGL
jgi:hypothetical protein